MRRHLSSHASSFVRVSAHSSLTALLITTLLLAIPATFADPALASSTWRVDTATRGEVEVYEKWQQFEPSYNGNEFIVAPSTKAPYATGTVHPDYLANGLNIVNFARYLAGLPYDVTLGTDRVDEAQHGAVLLAASNFSHNPDKPADMSQAFYDKGIASTSKSNIGYGHKDIQSFQIACLHDSSSASNLLGVGHRRWILNPPMKETGIGVAGSRYTTYAIDRSRQETVEYSAITWPSAGVFPIEFFDSRTPWSITINPARYDWDTSGHTVTLKRLGDGRVWTFTASQTNTSGQYFNADFRWMGVNNAFVFRPDPSAVTYAPGDEFEVTLSGGIRHKGTSTPATITYRTRFFSLASPPSTEPRTVDLQHDAGGVLFDRWMTGYSSAYSGGGYVYGRWTDTELTARFTGSKISWVGPKQPSYGRADVYIDGAYVETVDQYASENEATLSTVIWESKELADGPHTLTIRLTGAKNPASTGNVIVIDRFEVTGVSPEGLVRHAESDSCAAFSGSWIDATNPTYFGQSYSYSRWSGSSFTATFDGTKVAWIGPKTPHYGKADIYIDGKLVATVCQYDQAQAWRSRVWESATLPRGTHTLEIRVRGDQSAPSTAANVVVDAIDVTP